MKQKSSFFKNAGKSVLYTSKNLIESNMPTFDSTLESGKDLFSDIKRGLPRLRSKFKVTTGYEDRTIFRPAKDLINNAISDLKSGKFWNNDRDSSTGNSSMDEFLSMGDDDNTSSSSELNNSSLTKILSSSSMHNAENARMISESSLKGSEYLGKIYQTAQLQTNIYTKQHHLETMSKLNNIEKGVKSLVEFNINTTQSFYKAILDQTAEIQKNMDRIVNNLTTHFGEDKNKGRKATGVAKFFSNGRFSIKSYLNMVKENAFNEIGMSPDMIKMIFSGIKDNPLGFLLSQLTTGGPISKMSKSADNAFRNAMFGVLNRFNDWKNGKNLSNNEFLSTVQQIVGTLGTVNNKKQAKMDLSVYKNQAVTAELEQKKAKAIIEVIPEYLSQITKKLTGKDKYYNYDKGIFEDRSTAREIERSSYEYQQASSIGKSYDKISNRGRSLFNNKNYGNILKSDFNALVAWLVSSNKSKDLPSNFVYNPREYRTENEIRRLYKIFEKSGLDLVGDYKSYLALHKLFCTLPDAEYEEFMNDLNNSIMIAAEIADSRNISLNSSGQSSLYNQFDSSKKQHVKNLKIDMDYTDITRHITDEELAEFIEKEEEKINEAFKDDPETKRKALKELAKAKLGKVAKNGFVAKAIDEFLNIKNKSKKIIDAGMNKYNETLSAINKKTATLYSSKGSFSKEEFGALKGNLAEDSSDTAEEIADSISESLLDYSPYLVDIQNILYNIYLRVSGKPKGFVTVHARKESNKKKYKVSAKKKANAEKTESSYTETVGSNESNNIEAETNKKAEETIENLTESVTGGISSENNSTTISSAINNAIDSLPISDAKKEKLKNSKVFRGIGNIANKILGSNTSSNTTTNAPSIYSTEDMDDAYASYMGGPTNNNTKFNGAIIGQLFNGFKETKVGGIASKIASGLFADGKNAFSFIKNRGVTIGAMSALSTAFGLGPVPGAMMGMLFTKKKKNKASKDEEGIVKNMEDAEEKGLIGGLLDKVKSFFGGRKGRVRGAAKGALITTVLGLGPLPGAIIGGLFGSKKKNKDSKEDKNAAENIANTADNDDSLLGKVKGLFSKIGGSIKGFFGKRGKLGTAALAAGVTTLLGLGPIPGAVIGALFAPRKGKKNKTSEKAKTTALNILNNTTGNPTEESNGTSASPNKSPKKKKSGKIKRLIKKLSKAKTPEEANRIKEDIIAAGGTPEEIDAALNAGLNGQSKEGDIANSTNADSTEKKATLLDKVKGLFKGGKLKLLLLGGAAILFGTKLIKNWDSSKGILANVWTGVKETLKSVFTEILPAVGNLLMNILTSIFGNKSNAVGAVATGATLKTVAPIAGAGAAMTAASVVGYGSRGISKFKEGDTAGGIGDTAKAGLTIAKAATGAPTIAKLGGFIAKFLKKLATKGPVAKLLGTKGAQMVIKFASKISSKVTGAITKLGSKLGLTIGKKAAEATAKASNPAGWILVVVQGVAALIDGATDGTVRQDLKLPPGAEISIWTRAACGIVHALDDAFLLGILDLLGVRPLIIEFIAKLLMSDEERQKFEAQKAEFRAGYDNFVKENPGTELTFDQYNKIYNKTLGGKTWNWLTGNKSPEQELEKYKTSGQTVINYDESTNVVVNNDETGSGGRGRGKSLTNPNDAIAYATKVLQKSRGKANMKTIDSNTAKTIDNKSSSEAKNEGFFGRIKLFFKNLFGGNGGRGESTDQYGNIYYSQKDGRWGNNSFGTYDGHRDTIKDGGCGPTVAAMAIENMLGRGPLVTPDIMAKLALASGDKYTNGGTDPAFFNKVGQLYGINFSETSDLNKEALQALKAGYQVPLLGKGGAYGKGSHYMLATGMDNNGNISILDPNNKNNNKKHSVKSLRKNTISSMIPSFRGRGKSSRYLKMARGMVSGRGSGCYVKQWAEIVTNVKAAMANAIQNMVNNGTISKENAYNQKGYVYVACYGTTLKVRRDCTGYIEACLKFAGLMDENDTIRTADINRNNSKLEKMGFTRVYGFGYPLSINDNGPFNLQCGDICSRVGTDSKNVTTNPTVGGSGHAEIFAKYNSADEYHPFSVFTAGGYEDILKTGPSNRVANRKYYHIVWRYNAEGDNDITPISNIAGTSSSNTSVDSNEESSKGIGSILSAGSNILSNIGSIFSGILPSFATLISNILNGDNVSDNSENTESMSSISNNNTNTANNSVSKISSNDLTTNGELKIPDISDITPGTDLVSRQKAIIKVLKRAGITNKKSIAAIMGNLKGENSTFDPIINGLSRGEKSYGIAQWHLDDEFKNGKQVGRAPADLKNWNEVQQAQYLIKELINGAPDGSNFSSTRNAIMNDSNSLKNMIDILVDDFEKPNKKQRPKIKEDRLKFAQKFYDTTLDELGYAGLGGRGISKYNSKFRPLYGKKPTNKIPAISIPKSNLSADSYKLLRQNGLNSSLRNVINAGSGSNNNEAVEAILTMMKGIVELLSDIRNSNNVIAEKPAATPMLAFANNSANTGFMQKSNKNNIIDTIISGI